jgi:hypothetical protein
MAAETYLPKVNVVTVLPFDVVRFEESADISLTADGMMRVNVDGLYYIHLGLDWKGQAQTDIDTRMYGIRRKAAGDTTPPHLKDERLASFDHPGSESGSPTRASGLRAWFRFAARWRPMSSLLRAASSGSVMSPRHRCRA